MIALVGLLLAILLPALAAARRSSQRTQCAANLRQVGQLLFLYANDNKGEIPTAYARWPEEVAPREDPVIVTSRVWEFVRRREGGVTLLVRPPIGAGRPGYVDGAQVFHCPGDDKYSPHRRNENDWGQDPGHAPLSSLDGGRMSYRYQYVPPGGDAIHPVKRSNGGAEVRGVRGFYAGLERHNIRQKNAESLCVMFDMYPLFGTDDGEDEGPTAGTATAGTSSTSTATSPGSAPTPSTPKPARRGKPTARATSVSR